MTTENKAEIARLRGEIDAVDASIVAALARRAQLAYEVGVAKGGAPVYRPERERQVIDRAVAENHRIGGRLPDEVLAHLYLEVISACRSLEARPSVAYLGPEGTFTEMAVLAQFGSNVTAVPTATIDEAFHAAESGRTGFAVVPIENSTQGIVTRTVDVLLTTPLSIVGEVSIPIHHNLMNQSGRLKVIRIVAAHPQALAQCRTWLAQHLPHAELKAASSNAEAAKTASTDPTFAAVAAERAASLYGLTIVAPGIQDDARNRTRFLVLAPHAGETPTGCDKTSLVFSVQNRAGQLFMALEPLKRYGVSMMRLESRPARNGAWDYNFFMDVEGHVKDENVAAALSELKSETSYLKFLGSYPRASEK